MSGSLWMRPGTSVLILKSLPYDATVADVREYVRQQTTYTPEDVVLLRRADHPARHSGEALVTFLTSAQRNAAVADMHNDTFPTRARGKRDRVIQAVSLSQAEAEAKFMQARMRENTLFNRVAEETSTPRFSHDPIYLALVENIPHTMRRSEEVRQALSADRFLFSATDQGRGVVAFRSEAYRNMRVLHLDGSDIGKTPPEKLCKVVRHYF